MVDFIQHKSEQEIINFLIQNQFDAYPEISAVLYDKPGMEEWVYDIRITGDWKHVHLYLKYLMEQLGYVRLFCKDIYNPDYDGSDYGECMHRYAWKPAVDMFGLKYENEEED